MINYCVTPLQHTSQPVSGLQLPLNPFPVRNDNRHVWFKSHLSEQNVVIVDLLQDSGLVDAVLCPVWCHVCRSWKLDISLFTALMWVEHADQLETGCMLNLIFKRDVNNNFENQFRISGFTDLDYTWQTVWSHFILFWVKEVPVYLSCLGECCTLVLWTMKCHLMDVSRHGGEKIMPEFLIFGWTFPLNFLVTTLHPRNYNEHTRSPTDCPLNVRLTPPPLLIHTSKHC